MSTKKTDRYRQLSLQSLEERNLLAGNVFGYINGSTLNFVGDLQDNAMVFEEIAPNTVRAAGLAGTTINGLPSQHFTLSPIESISIYFGNGRNQVIVHNLSLTDTPDGSLSIGTSDLDDMIVLDRVATSDRVSIQSYGGDDQIIINQLETDDFYTSTRAGNDHVEIFSSRVNEFELFAGDGFDQVRIDRLDVNDDFRLFANDGGSDIQLDHLQVGQNLQVGATDGDDLVHINDTHTGNHLTVWTGNGDDHQEIHDSSSGGELGLSGGHDRDTLLARNCQAGTRFLVTMGDGDDQTILTDITASTISLQTGTGNDFISMQRAETTSGMFYVHFNAGSDVLEAEQLVAATDLIVHGDGNGDHHVTLRDVYANHDVRVRTWNGDDVIQMNQVKARHNVFAHYGEGANILAMSEIRAGNRVTASGNGGADVVHLELIDTRYLNVHTGAGNDLVTMQYINACNQLTVYLGDGDDVLQMSHSYTGLPILYGGPGTDTLYDLPNAFDEVLAASSFEVIL